MRSKDIGTRAETAVVKLAHRLGFPDAERMALAGKDDKGDVRLCTDPLVILEVKAGKSSQNASWSQIQAWMQETKVERNNAFRSGRKDLSDWIGFLVTQRKGYGLGRVDQWCLWTLDDDPLLESLDGTGQLPAGMYPLQDFLKWFKEDRCLD